LEPTIGHPASESEAALIAECKRIAYELGLHELAYSLPDKAIVFRPCFGLVLPQIDLFAANLDVPSAGLFAFPRFGNSSHCDNLL
jgi:hypothetical protein